jgi:hypothetical protein
MSEANPKTTLREFREYFDLSCESSREIAARIGRSTVDHLGLARRQKPPEGSVVGKASEISG